MHDDLIQQATADLLEWERRRERPLTEEELRRVGFRILERRVFDAFRDDVRRWASTEPLANPDDIETPDRSPERSVEYSRLLKALIEVLTDLTPADRALVLRDEFSRGKTSAMTDAERKRLSRLRQQIRSLMLERHGIDVDNL
jgi:hypothetical protein